MTFEDDIRQVINRHCYENGSNTPDHILAAFMCRCLAAFEQASRDREKWYGRSCAPAQDKITITRTDLLEAFGFVYTCAGQTHKVLDSEIGIALAERLFKK